MIFHSDRSDFEKTGIGFLIISLLIDRIMKSGLLCGLLDRLRELTKRGSGLKGEGEGVKEEENS